MNHETTVRHSLPTVLIVNDEGEKLTANSAIFASLNQVSMSISEAIKVLSWIQQNQPDLIILNLELRQIIKLQLVAALRLDWLTRKIPIMVITNSNRRFQLGKKLDCDVCLIKPYSAIELGKAICSLISTPACEVYLEAV